MSVVRYERRPDGVALITLNRPDRLNAMTTELMTELSDALTDVAADRAVRCVVLTGAGRAFCAGGDVKAMATGGGALGTGVDGSIAAQLLHGVHELRRFQERTSYVLHTMPKPTVAMVNGPAMGAGLSLALACDLRVASDQARFGTAFRNVALTGDFGGAYFLQRLVGMARARELYFTGEILDAERALHLGIVNRVVPHDRLLDETMALAAQLAAGPTLAFALMKENLNLAAQADLRAVLAQEALHQRLAGLSDDHRAAALAFVEKRPPVFRGQ
jgi:2-(1,2-epoxy-1,2-dihydrophenyl)acetyl-CoA isomerase